MQQVYFKSAMNWVEDSNRRKISMFSFRGRQNFEDAVRPHLEVLYRVAVRLCRNTDDAEDVVSQTLFQACRAWNNFDGDHLKSWLLRILKNEFLGNQRKKSVRPRESELDLEVGDNLRSWNEIASNLNSEKILSALEELPMEFRMVSVLCDVEQLSYEEAATALDIPIGTVRSRLFRARAKLREILSDFVTETV